MRDTLICTVGTSLKNNILREAPGGIRDLLETGNVKGLALELLSRPPEDRLNGAEINSVHGILTGRLIDHRGNLVLLVSDTEDGALTGRTLSHFYENPRNAERFESVAVKTVEGLTDQDVRRFRNEGLRNLVRIIGQEARRKGSERLLINATGGYKAQISFAAMIGQALDIPVCYLFERFSEVIQLPPQPVSLDLTLWLDHVDLFFDLTEQTEAGQPFVLPDERLMTLVDMEQVDGCWLTTLSSTGQLFHESFRYRFSRLSKSLLPPVSNLAPAEKKIRYEDANAGKHKGLNTYLGKIRQCPYVTEIYTHYYNPDLNARCAFRKSAKGIPGQVEGVFSNAGATTKFDVITMAASKEQLQACIADLNNRFIL